MNYLNKRLISLLGGALALFSPGCSPKNINLSQYPIEKPLVAGVDGFLSNDLNIVGSKLEKECSTPVVIEPIGNWQENMPEIRQAYKQGRNIILTGFSMGSEQVKFIANRCREEGIIIELVFIIDPTYTSFGNLDLPDNVKRIKPYFSTDKIDFMSWARGNPEKFRNTGGNTKTEKPTFLRGTHLNCVKWNNLRTDLIDEVKKYTK
ncbi:hypothetical protein HYV88_05030 [Candidatus Woesearchaeota archaeon]|nr:hypothetical protein [Candidatus Woesearchaeota archaeon]